MAKNTEKNIASRTVQEYINIEMQKDIPVPLEINGETFNMIIKRRLSRAESKEFIDLVMASLIEDGEPRLCQKDFALKYYTIVSYSNIRMPNDDDKRYAVVYNTDIYKKIVEAPDFDKEFYYELLNAVEQQLDFELKKMTNKSKIDDLLDMVMGIVSKMDKNIDFQKAFDTLDKISKIEKIDEKALVNAIAESKETK
jgi:hypothetical protein